MSLYEEIKLCSLCVEDLPFKPKPILQFCKDSKILIVGQAPGKLAHESGIPWNDKSGERLRNWLDIEKKVFYDEQKFAIVPMGFCYPGKAKSGDLPPRKECRAFWLDQILAQFVDLKLIILIGQHAVEHFLGKGPLDLKIRQFAVKKELIIVLPHPSPRNNIWLSKNVWFENEYLPMLKTRVQKILSDY